MVVASVMRVPVVVATAVRVSVVVTVMRVAVVVATAVRVTVVVALLGVTVVVATVMRVTVIVVAVMRVTVVVTVAVRVAVRACRSRRHHSLSRRWRRGDESSRACHARARAGTHAPTRRRHERAARVRAVVHRPRHGAVQDTH